MKKSALYGIMTAMAVAACGRAAEPVEPGSEPLQVRAGDTITLRYGASARLDDSVRIVFRAVESDSRCPINVTCVWEGDAAIRIDAARGSGPRQPLVLHTAEEPKSGAIGDYTIELLEVAPERVQPDSLKPSDYSVRIAISRG